MDINYLINFIRWKLHFISTEEFYRLTPINIPNEPIMEDINIDYLRDRCTYLGEVSIPISVTPCQYMGIVNKLPDDSKQGNIYMVSNDLYINTGNEWEKLQ